MKRALSLLTTLTLTLFFVPVHSAMAGRAQGMNRAFGAGTLHELTYDGFCDGLAFEIVADGVNGDQIGCLSGDAIGVVADGSLVFCYCGGAEFEGLMTVIGFDHTWTHYECTGGGISLLNSGTWSSGPPPAAAAGSNSARR